jgi:hypothetical protein
MLIIKYVQRICLFQHERVFCNHHRRRFSAYQLVKLSQPFGIARADSPIQPATWVLYLPFSSFTNPNNMVCFMQYGAGDPGTGRCGRFSRPLGRRHLYYRCSVPYIYIGDGTQSGVEFWTNFVEPVFPYVVINEVDCDTPGNDMMEFVELYGDPEWRT